jgi:hypothetical protein
MLTTNEQRRRALDLIDDIAGGDFHNALLDMELALERALDATEDHLARWEALSAEGFDECSVPAARIANMTAEDRLAWVARLVYTVAVAYGIGRSPLIAWGSSPAALVRGVNDIDVMPLKLHE